MKRIPARSLILDSFAKLNLYLEVINKRADNFHDLKTVFERISLSDKIIIKPRRDKTIKIICSDSVLNKKPFDNLAYRSAKLLQDAFKVERGAEIRIIKRIPIGAGMGGGSSNAAFVLLGLNQLWNLGLSKKELASFAAELGSDVPFFIYGAPFALAGGRGEKIRILPSLKDSFLWHILVIPRIKVPTPLIYSKYDDFKSGQGRICPGKKGISASQKSCRKPDMNVLTRPKYNVKLLTSGIKNKDLSDIKKGVFNSLEPVTAFLYPEIKKIEKILSLLGLKAILMSGSGPTVFAVCSSKKEALSAEKRIRKINRTWRIFVARTA